MRIRTLHLLDFKRFKDLQIDLGEDPKKIIALVGPNGSGKSSILDAFEEFSSTYKGRGGKASSYYKKSIHAEVPSDNNYNPGDHVIITSDTETYTRTSFYIRSAYRFTPRLAVDRIRKLNDVEEDNQRPQYLIDTDARMQDNYERLLGRFYDDVYDQEITGRAWSQNNIDGINAVLEKVLDIKISFLGNPVKGEGSLYFEKGDSKRFKYEILSAGEKEVVDLILDLYVKRDVYKNSVICIDEPELHLNTAIQRKLLIEIEKLVPDTSQLWIATHSLGFLRALQEDLKEKTSVIDFTNQDFDHEHALSPILGSRKDWLRIFETALEDLTGLLAPKRIIYCEGRSDPTAAGDEQGLDAEVYNEVFAGDYPETLFVSSGGGGEVKKNAILALKVLKKALTDVDFLLLKDRDTLTEAERTSFLSEDQCHRMLFRREMENYLFDKEVVSALCVKMGLTFEETRYDAAVTDIVSQDLKPVQQEIQAACIFQGNIIDFKRALGTFLKPGIGAYEDLRNVIFS